MMAYASAARHDQGYEPRNGGKKWVLRSHLAAITKLAAVHCFLSFLHLSLGSTARILRDQITVHPRWWRLLPFKESLRKRKFKGWPKGPDGQPALGDVFGGDIRAVSSKLSKRELSESTMDAVFDSFCGSPLALFADR